MARYEFVSALQLDSLREAGDLVFEGIDRDELGNKVEVSCIHVFIEYANPHDMDWC